MNRPQPGDFGLDQADRMWKWVFGKWVAQGSGTSPVYPVVIVARWNNGVYKSYNPEKDSKIQELEEKIKELEMAAKGLADILWEDDSGYIFLKEFKALAALLNTGE
jgi:hypothetical protein